MQISYKKFIFQLSGVLCFSVLAGCGSGGSSGGTGFEDLANQQELLLAAFNDEERVPAVDLVTGGGTYEGATTFTSQTDPEDGAIGAMILEIDFSSASIDGTVDNFYTLSGVPTEGQLVITNGRFAPEKPEGEVIETRRGVANFTGFVVLDSGRVDVDPVSNTLIGRFSGDDAEYFGGDISADVTREDGEAGFFVGEFALEEQ